MSSGTQFYKLID